MSFRVAVQPPSTGELIDQAVSNLISDAGAIVQIFDDQGVVRYTSGGFAHAGVAMEQLLGRPLADVLPRDVAAERVAAIRRALDTAEPVRLAGMLFGTWRLTTYRPLPGPEGVRLGMGVCREPTASAGFDQPSLPTGYELAAHHDLGPLSILSRREVEVLRLIALGLTSAEIAKKLHRSVKTIEWYRVALGNKLDVGNRVELAHIALVSGLIYLPQDLVRRLRPEWAAEPETLPAK